jgi:uncharacterized protein YndB with AHSA1/START domain
MNDEISVAGDTRAIHLEREYQGTPDELWDAWTSPERLARWLGTPAGPLLDTTEPVRLDMGPGDDEWVDVRVVTADRPNLLELAWAFPGESGTMLRVRFVALDAERTRLVLDHSGFTTASTGYGAGWQAYLEGELARELGGNLDSTWEDRFGEALPVWRERAAGVAR